MVFKTGKWSMADVMLVAIFMAYIGFSEIAGEQLRQLEGMTTNMEVLTTNKSNLQIGCLPVCVVYDFEFAGEGYFRHREQLSVDTAGLDY
jgi:hypothetical protein